MTVICAIIMAGILLTAASAYAVWELALGCTWILDDESYPEGQ